MTLPASIVAPSKSLKCSRHSSHQRTQILKMTFCQYFHKDVYELTSHDCSPNHSRSESYRL